MHTLTKTLLTSTLLAAPTLAADIPPTTQPATRPAPLIAQSNEPLVIPDGTSPQNPGPQFHPAPEMGSPPVGLQWEFSGDVDFRF